MSADGRVRLDPEPDLAWVSHLSWATHRRVAQALREATIDRGLSAHIRREHRREGRDSYGQIDAPWELYALARVRRPRRILEVGVSSGVSSAYLLAALRRNRYGRLCSVDLPTFQRCAGRDARVPRNSWSLPPGRAPGWAIPPALVDRWELRLGDHACVVPQLLGHGGPFEMVVYDVPHDDTQLRREFRALDPYVLPGSPVIVDHGPGGGRCPALAEWARRRGCTTSGRRASGLFGFGPRGPPPAAARGSARVRARTT